MRVLLHVFPGVVDVVKKWFNSNLLVTDASDGIAPNARERQVMK